MSPAEPFLFRNYEYPLSATPLAKKMMAAPGSSSHQVWQAVRASSAAPYYLDDFKCGMDRQATRSLSESEILSSTVGSIFVPRP